MSQEQNYIPVAFGASAPPQTSRTVSEVLSFFPSLDSLSLLPQFRIEYVYPENYVPISIETPADALMLFRAFWEREENKDPDKVYVLLLQKNRILSLQPLGKSATLSRFLRISKVARLAYLAGADNIILLSTHRESEVEDFEQSEQDFLLSLPEEFESFDLALTDCIRIGEDLEYSLFTAGYSEYAGFTPPDYYTWHRNYNL
ncbi:hypothetical protein [Larkinella humicola]|uniref:Uncharacterized protein n=1 Tax=Larkinella humicola TaxID=2607654 RepID=A0A5N1JG77_9BACT|nr:hypothetical protein [Larkinella humicola]KAA9349739.1 hypothetical protein F0P93_20010 [Larkinella humicola]